MADCLAGDAAARGRFQQEFGPLIYRFVACAGGSRLEPGDFYLYAFEDDRLYRRLRSYEGRASLGPFLRGYALPDLLRQFQQMTRRQTLDTISLDTDCAREPGGMPAAAADGEPRTPAHGPADEGDCGDLLAQLSAEKRLLVKLLYIEDFELAPDDVQLLAQRSGRPTHEVVEQVERARESVRRREAVRQRKQSEAESAAQWILQYERRLARVENDLGNVPPRSAQAERLREQQAELERKHAWRHEQRERALAETQRTTVTLRYREIAEILNEPVGTISAQIARVRQELLNLAAQHASRRKGAPADEPFDKAQDRRQ